MKLPKDSFFKTTAHRARNVSEPLLRFPMRVFHWGGKYPSGTTVEDNLTTQSLSIGFLPPEVVVKEL